MNISLFMFLEKYIFLYYFFLDIKEIPLELEYWWNKEMFLCSIVPGLIWVYWIFSLLICLCPFHFSFFSLSHAFHSLNTEKKLAISMLNPKLIVLWEVYKLEFGGGMGREMGREFRREGTYVYLWLIHVEVWQKTTKFCKVIIFQLKDTLKKILEPLGKNNTFFWRIIIWSDQLDV